MSKHNTIRRLLALAGDNAASPAERQLARNKARELMRKYAVQTGDLHDSTPAHTRMQVVLLKFKLAKWRVWLYTACAEYCGVYAVKSPGTGLYLSGPHDGIARTQYLYDVLRLQMEAQNTRTGRLERNSFRDSFAQGVLNKVRENANSTALVFYANKGRNKDLFTEKTGMRIHTRTHRYRLDQEAEELGRQARFTEGVHARMERGRLA